MKFNHSVNYNFRRSPHHALPPNSTLKEWIDNSFMNIYIYKLVMGLGTVTQLVELGTRLLLLSAAARPRSRFLYSTRNLCIKELKTIVRSARTAVFVAGSVFPCYTRLDNIHTYLLEDYVWRKDRLLTVMFHLISPWHDACICVMYDIHSHVTWLTGIHCTGNSHSQVVYWPWLAHVQLII